MAEPSAQKKILFVDDDKFLLDMYVQKFAKAGYEAKAADSTESAMKMLHEGYAPDVMLVDVVMPGMDGLEFVEAARREQLAKGAVTIMLTNQSESDDMSRSQKIGVDGYVIKATTIPSDVLREVEKIYEFKKSKN